VFWKSLSSVPAADVLGHRALWIFVFVMVVHLARRSWRDVIAAASSPRILVLEIVAAALLGTNWLTWVWAMNTDRVLEGSLGYFINPLVSVFLGVVFLGESLRRGQWVAISLATIGVVWLTVGVGSLPWVSLVLGFTFGFYGLLKKKIDRPPLVSLAIEVSVMIIPALVFLSLRTSDGAGVVGPSSPGTTALLVASGAFTGVPLLLFAGAARRIPLSLIGMLQYLAPRSTSCWACSSTGSSWMVAAWSGSPSSGQRWLCSPQTAGGRPTTCPLASCVPDPHSGWKDSASGREEHLGCELGCLGVEASSVQGAGRHHVGSLSLK
jgi:chloramphenicol-sensitive protein RarD